MPQRLDEFNKKFIYTNTNPENIVAAKKNAYFFRRGKDFYVNHEGNLDAAWEKLPYRTVIIPPPPLTKLIQYKTPTELWIKKTDGYYNEYEQLLPKTGWKLVSTSVDVFARTSPKRKYNWIFPPPSSSDDPMGSNGNRSYDKNYFYAKIDGRWYRTPITVYTYVDEAGPDVPSYSTSLPFVDAPRYLPVPPTPDYYPQGDEGLQSYDKSFFYIHTDLWKRANLLFVSGVHKMTEF